VSAVPADARRIGGPSALGDDPARFMRLTWALAVTEFRLRFYGSALGYLWQLMRPLLLFGVLYLVFSQGLRVGTGVHYFPVVLLTGIILFQFIAEAVSGSVTSIVDRENLIRKVQFPRMVVPCSVVLTAVFNLALNLVVVVIFAAISGVKLNVRLLEVPVVLLLLVAFALGVSFVVSALYVRFRDVKPIADVALQVLFYATPVLYPIENILDRHHPEIAHWMMVNPFAALIEQMRHAAIDPTAPSAFDVAGAWWRLAIAGAIVLGAFVFGFLTFRRLAPRVAEEL
jgi:ABC-2 type transport system permease protein